MFLTIGVAVAFQPVRRRLETWADRWVFGRRVDHYEVLRSLGATLERSIGLTELMPRLAGAVREGLGARWVRVSLPGEGATWPAENQETAGTPDGDAALTQDLRRGEELIGRIECGPKDGGYTAEDRQLLATLSGQAATAIANVGLTAQLSERLGELARSRNRILSAQDAERRRIERDLHDGAQQQVVALITKLRLARNQVERNESPAPLLAEMQADVRELLTELRELAHGIHPPVLSDNGLVAAVEARAGRLPVPVVVRAEETLRRQRFPEDVEGAAYFVVCEALTNVLKHADASGTEIELAATGEVLSIDVSDDGAGFGVPGRGTGLTNSRDRVEALGGRLGIDSRPGAGTRLHAELPLRPPRAGPCLTPCGWCSPRTTTSSARGPAGCCRTPARSRCSPRWAPPRSCTTPSGASRPTPSSPTSACRRATTWRGSRPRAPSAPTIPRIGVVVLSQHTDQSYAFELLRDGAAGLAYLLKDRLGDVEDLVHALREVSAGGSVIDPVVIDALVARRARTASPLTALTARELDVLREMAQGRTNAGIEAALHLSASTVEKHVNAIFTKLQLTDAPVHRRVAAVLAFLKG